MVYKEEAYKKFKQLIDEIELRIVKSVFSISQVTEVVLTPVDDSKLQVTSTDVETMKIGQDISPAANPLFMQPAEKKKIRV